MTRRQEKIQRRQEEHRVFMLQRRAKQLAMLKQAYEVGLKLYEDNKDTLSPEEVEQIEKMKTEQLAALAKLEEEFNALDTRTEA